jgi:hypothetical protein
MQTPAIPLLELRTSRRTELKFPYPVSPSRRMGIRVLSLMNSAISTTCVQLASLQSRRPRLAAMERPLAQIPSKPASSTILALRPLWASMRKLRLSL